MGLNFLGLGFSLGAQDKGLAASIKETSSGLADISKSVVGIGLASAKMVFRPPDLKPTIGLATQLAGDVKLNTTALEQYAVAANKTTSAGLAGLNLTEKEFAAAQGRIAGIAFDMNVPVENVTKSFVALTEAGIDTNKMTEYGFKNLEEYQKVMEVTGTSTEDFAAAMGTMGSQMGMTKKQITATIQGVAAIGKKMNIGSKAVSGMADTVKLLNANSNLLPQNWSPAKMDKFIKGTTIVTGALTAIGVKSEDAMAASKALTAKLLEGSKGLAGMYTGLKNQLPDVYDVVTQNLGNIDDAFKMLSESPDQFMLKMGGLVSKVNDMHLRPDDMNRFRLQMEQTFGPEIMATFQKKGFGKLGPLIQEANKPIKDQDKALGDLAKRHQDGRTYAERFAWAQDQIQTSLKKVNGVMSDATYLKTYVAQGKQFTAWVSATAAKGGPLGKLTDAIIEVKNRGFGGFLAAHSKFGFAMSEAIQMMQPMLQYLPAIKMAFMALASPIGIVVGALAGLYFAMKDLAKGKDSVLRPIIEKIKTDAPILLQKFIEIGGQVFDTLYGVFQSIDWGKVIDTVFAGLTKVIDVIFKVIDSINWNKVGEALGAVLTKAADVALMILKGAIKLGARILNWLDSINWGEVGKKFGDAFAKVAVVVGEAIYKILSNLPEILMKVFQHAADFIIGALDSIKEYLIKKFPSAAGPIGTIFDILKGIVKVVSGALQIAFKVIGTVLGFIWDIVKGIFKAIGWVIDKVSGPLKFAFGLIADVVGWLWDKIKAVGSAIGSVISGIGSAISKVAGGIADVVSGGNSDLEESLKKQIAMQKAAMDSIKIVNDAAIAARLDAEDKALAASGGKAQNWTKTVEGDVIKSTDAFVRYEKNAAGTIEQVAHATAAYTRAIVGGEAFAEMDAMQNDLKRMRESAEMLKAGSDEWQKAMDAQIEHGNQAHEEYFKKWNVRWDVMYQANEDIQKQYAVENGLIAQAKVQGAGYYTALTSLQTKLAEQSGVLRLKLEQLRQEGKEGSDEFKKLNDDYIKMSAEGLQKLGLYKDIVAGNIAKTVDSFAKDSQDKLMAAERAAHVLSEVYKAETNEMMTHLQGIAPKTAEVYKGMVEELAAAQKKEVQNFIVSTDLKGQALNDAIKGIEAKYKERGAEITKTLKGYNDTLVTGSEDGALAALEKIKQANAGMLKDVNIKTKEAASEIQKQFGVTGDAALESVNQIAAIDPNIFKKNMAVVKATFMGFLKEMDAQGKKLMDNTTKSFNTMWDTMDKGWKANQKLMTDFGSAADKTLDTFWNLVVTKAGMAAGKIIDITKNIEVALKTMARTINLMDLLASPDQITQWAAAVVSALSYAFRTGGAADAMISASYDKALQMAGQLQAQAQPATPDTSKTQASPSSSAITAAQELLRTMNHPAWATDKKELIPSELAKMNENLEATLAALRALAEGRAATPGKTPPKARH